MTTDQPETPEGLVSFPRAGLFIAAVGLAISMAGVIANNLLLDHILAMQIWIPSNTLYCIYFFGRTRGWWNGHIGDGLMCVNYAFMLASGIWGLMQIWQTR
jgi:hypothetical protein